MTDIKKLNINASKHAESLIKLQNEIESLFSFGSASDYLKFYDCLDALAKGELSSEQFHDFASIENAESFWRKTKQILQTAEYLKNIRIETIEDNV